MRYVSYEVTLSEVPQEISLTIMISGCPNRCPDCHSKFAWDRNVGKILNKKTLKQIIEKYKNSISCICFLGGEWENDLIEMIEFIKKYNLKIALYTGLDYIDSIDEKIIMNLDYIKIGHYDKNMGSLDKKTTNQKMYKINNTNFEDITHLFWK